MDLLKQPLSDYIRHRFGPDAVLEHEERFPRGSSRLTHFVAYRPRPEAPLESLVFRGNFEGGSTIHSSLEQEYFIYERLGHTSVPVAKVLWWEDDPDWVHRPFYVREQITGHWDIPNFRNPDPAYDSIRIAISKEHLGKLALVHAVDWRSLGFEKHLPAPSSLEDCANHFLDGMIKALASFQREPMPIVTEALVSLRRHLPVAPAMCLCKGTNGLGEEVFNDGIIVAMSDWEEASIGDPAADFASLQDLIPEIDRNGENFWGLEKAVAYYQKVSGINVTVENIRFYQQMRMLAGIVFGEKSAVIVSAGKADIRQAWSGTETLHVVKRMLAGSIGIAPPVDLNWFFEMNETVI